MSAREYKDNSAYRERVLAQVRVERLRQDAKWGEQNHDLGYWLGILIEEVGEFAKAYIEGDMPHARTEMVEAAAVAVALVEYMDRRVLDASK